MLAFQRTIYDDFLTGIGTVDRSSGLYDQLLGLPDELEVAITADQVGASTLIWYKPGDGEWSTTVNPTCDRVSPAAGLTRLGDMTPGVNDQPACFGGVIGTHAEWILAGTTVAVVFVNSCIDPEGAASKTSWSPSLVLHGAIMGAFNSAEWQDL
jgi:hypothetical protein